MKFPLLVCILIPAAALSLSAAGKLPLAFEPNQGQGNRESMFFARGPGYSVALRPDGATIHAKAKSGKSALTVMRLLGASTTAKPHAKDALPGKVNYFIGSDPKLWHVNLPTFAKVEFPQAYPGIDMIYYGSQGQLEYDFVVQPGANPASIRIKFSGAIRTKLTANGDLEIGELRQHKPLAYQNIDGNGRTEVACRYVLRANQEVAIQLGTYDRSYPLIIDPVLSYSTFVGGSGNDTVASIKVDATGNLFMAGFTTSINFPVRGATQSGYGGTNSALMQAQFGDAFVSKLNPAGNAMLYSTYLGGSGDDFATALSIDSGGNAYVVGATQSANFPTTVGALQRTYKGFAASDDNGFYNPGDAFVAKLNPAGSALVYSTYLGGALNDLPLGVATDSSANAIIVGTTKSSDFPTTATALSKTYRGSSNTGSSVAGDGFVSILNPAGTALTYSTFLGGRGHDAARGVAVDAQNNIYICGMTSSTDFPLTAGAFQTTYLGNANVVDFDHPIGHGFVVKLSPAGVQVYGTFLGGSLRDAAAAIAVDGTGAAYVVGSTASTDFPTTANALQKINKGRATSGSLGDINYGDAFITKLNPTGSALLYSTYLGGAADETATDIALFAGSAYVTGFTLSKDFPVTADALQATNAGFGGQALAAFPAFGFNSERERNSGDAFLVKISAAGDLTYSSFFGGRGDDAGLAIAVDSAGNAYIAGNTVSSALATSISTLQPVYGGASAQFPRGDGFVVKFDFGGTLAAPPARVSVVTGFPNTATAGIALSTPFTVEVVDSQGLKLSGIVVSFSATGATVNPASATSDAQGRASTTVTPGAVGTAIVTATVAGIPAATANISVVAAAPLPVVTAIVNGASFQSTIAPGSWITVFLQQTAPAIVSASAVPLPTTLGAYRILVGGIPIPLLAAYPLQPGTQLNAQLPYEIPLGPAQVSVEVSGVASVPFPFAVQASAPGIFVFGDNRAVAQNVQPNGTLVVNTADVPVPAGDYIVAYLTGQGALDNPVPSGNVAGSNPLSIPKLPYSATIGGRPATVAFLGMTPGQIALVQANILIPADMQPGTYPLVITIGAAPSNAPQISVTARRP